MTAHYVVRGTAGLAALERIAQALLRRHALDIPAGMHRADGTGAARLHAVRDLALRLTV